MNRAAKILIPIVILLASALISKAIIAVRPDVQTKRPEAPAPLVRVAVIERGPHQYLVTAQGTVAPRTESALTAEVAGRLVSVSPNFEAGGFFEKDEVLVTIDRYDYESAVAQAKAQVAAAELRLAREEEEAKVALEEWETLQRQGNPSALVLRKPQMAEAKAAVDAAKAAQAKSERDLARTRIRAPYVGRIRHTNVDRGGFVGPGTPVALIYAVDAAEIRLPLADEQLRFLDLPLDYRGDGDPENRPRVRVHAMFAGKRHTWQGEIVRTEGEIDPRSRMVHAVARVADPYARGDDPDRPPLAVGMFVDAEIIGKTVQNAAVLPRAVLRGTDQVLIVDDEDRLRFRTVEVLRLSGDQMVLGSGVEAGERICLSSLDSVVDGMKVRTVGAAVGAAPAGTGGGAESEEPGDEKREVSR